jgi:hypothetical protein
VATKFQNGIAYHPFQTFSASSFAFLIINDDLNQSTPVGLLSRINLWSAE